MHVDPFHVPDESSYPSVRERSREKSHPTKVTASIANDATIPDRSDLTVSTTFGVICSAGKVDSGDGFIYVRYHGPDLGEKI